MMIMTNDREMPQQQQPGRESEENFEHDRVEQFNELSELSLEERMNVADQMGIPVHDAGEAAATGRASAGDTAAGPESNSEVEPTDRLDRPSPGQRE
jgi:hypothetical protein